MSDLRSARSLNDRSEGGRTHLEKELDLDSTLRVVVSPSDNTGCGHYRCIYPSMALGHRTDLDIEVLPTALERLDLQNPGVMVLQRPVHARIADTTIPWLRARGWAIVVEIDDNLSALDPSHFCFKVYHPSYSSLANWKNLESCAEQADLVTVTTADLARQYAPHGRYSILPNYVPEKYLVDAVPDEPEEKLFGWGGTIISHPGDLDIAFKAIRRGATTPGWKFAGLGDPNIVRYVGMSEGITLPGTSVEDWVPAFSQFQVGIVPLAGHRFNEGKSYLKGLEMAARGVPFIASSTTPYRELENEGAGVTCSTQKDWVRTLQDHLRSRDRRRSLAEDGLDVARRNTYELNAWRWHEAWVQARKNYEARVTKADLSVDINLTDLIIR